MVSEPYNETDTTPSIPIIYEDPYLLAIDKPAGLLSQKDQSGDPDVSSLCQQYLAKQPDTSRYAGLLHRLDRPVGGLMLLAKNRDTARVLSTQFKQGTIQKTYYAVVNGKPPKNGVLTHHLLKDPEINKVRVTSAKNKASQYAELAFQRMESERSYTLLKIHLVTGRSHQIRVQFSEEGFPLLGDQKYGGKPISSNSEHKIALHSYQLTFYHPKLEEEMELNTPPPLIHPWKLFKTVRA